MDQSLPCPLSHDTLLFGLYKRIISMQTYASQVNNRKGCSYIYLKYRLVPIFSSTIQTSIHIFSGTITVHAGTYHYSLELGLHAIHTAIILLLESDVISSHFCKLLSSYWISGLL